MVKKIQLVLSGKGEELLEQIPFPFQTRRHLADPLASRRACRSIRLREQDAG